MNRQLPLAFDGRLPRTLKVPVPPMPSTVRYVDDYTDIDHSVSDLSTAEWVVFINGSPRRLKFHPYASDPLLQRLIQAFAADLLVRMAASTSALYLDSLANLEARDIVELVECAPDEVRASWDVLRTKVHHPKAFVALKALLKFLAERKVGAWRPSYLTFISSSLPLPPHDKFAAIRSGDVFISIEAEALLVRWIEGRANASNDLSLEDLIDTAIVICSYQFAMRPKQIGALRRRDCRVLATVSGEKTVHLSFRMIKQRTAALKQMPLVRRVKREWARIFSEIYKNTDGQEGDAHLFGYGSVSQISKRLRALLSEITKSDWTATDLRHSGAMRLVDAGASSEELAEFMGHSSLESGLVYYDASATQAERVNQALGISETYREVARMGAAGFISSDELAKLKGDEQVAGVPHGIPIAGIGACTTGQPSCPFNPVTACYGCPKFMPVADMSIHHQVLRDFRGVVSFFYSTSRGEVASPAYLQLKRTISEVQSVINELGATGAE